MTRSERNNLLAILTAVVLIIAGIAVTLVFGVKDVETAAVAKKVAATEAAPAAAVEETVDPLADAPVNSIHSGDLPPVDDSFGARTASFERMRSWDGEVEVWRGAQPQIILGPGGNWFPAGQPGCGEGRYLVEFAGAGTLTASLRDELGEVAVERDARRGWMLLDDCLLPHVTLGADADATSDTVTFEVHEFQPAG